MTLSPSHFASHSLPRLARWTMATLALSASACGSLATRQASLNTEPAVPTASAVRTGAAAPSARAQSESPELLADEAVETEAAGRVAIVPVNGRRALVRQSLRAASRISIPRPGDCPAGGCQPGAPCETCADKDLFLSCNFNILSSTVSLQIIRYANIFLVCPIRWVLSMACCSTAGFHQGSTIYT